MGHVLLMHTPYIMGFALTDVSYPAVFTLHLSCYTVVILSVILEATLEPRFHCRSCRAYDDRNQVKCQP